MKNLAWTKEFGLHQRIVNHTEEFAWYAITRKKPGVLWGPLKQPKKNVLPATNEH